MLNSLEKMKDEEKLRPPNDDEVGKFNYQQCEHNHVRL